MMKKPLGVTSSATTSARPPASHSHHSMYGIIEVYGRRWVHRSEDQCDKIEGFMPLILVTNDDGVTSDGIHALADAMQPLGDVLVVAPLQEASAIGHALTLRRPLRIETISDGVYGVDGTPTDCVNLACAIILKRAAGPRGVGHQQGLEPRRRHHLLGHGVGRARRRAARARRALRVSLKRTPTYDFGPSAAAAAKVAAAVLKHGLPPRTLHQHQRAGRHAEGHARDDAGQAQSRHEDRRAHRSARQRVLLDRRSARRIPSRQRPLRLRSGEGRLCFGHAAAARHDRI